MWQAQQAPTQHQQQSPIVVSPSSHYHSNSQTNGIHHNTIHYNGHNTPNNGQSPGTPNGNQHTWFSDTTFMSGILTNTTPTLTPTTLASIEQSFIELQSVPVTTANTSTTVQHQADLSHQAGFVPPVVDPRNNTAPVSNMPIKTEYDMYSTDDSCNDSDWMPTVAKRSRPDLTSQAVSIMTYGQALNTVVPTTIPQRKTPGRKGKVEILSPGEENKRSMRRERNKLAAAKCRQRRVDHTNELLGETEDLEEIRAKLESEVSQLQQQKEQLEFLLQAHKPICTVAKLVVKPDPDHHHQGTSKCVDTTCTTTCTSVTTSTASFSSHTVRPNTLPLSVQNMGNEGSTGVPISTPSNIYGQLSLDTLMDGHSTGLTPITGVPSCASQVKRQSSDSSPSDNGLASPTRLMAL